MSPGTASAAPAGAPAHSLETLAVERVEPLGEAELPSVTLVVLNYNGAHHLDRCFTSLQELDYPKERLAIILIDNGSQDESLALMRKKHPWVRLVEHGKNHGFSAGCNHGGLLAADHDVLALLNNDMRVEPGFLRALVAPLARGRCQATTAKMLSWNGKQINSAGGGMNFHGIGIQHGYLDDPGPEHDFPRRSLFACGGAMAIDRQVFQDLGGFDEEFFAYYEDVDLGWRMWVLGHEVHYVPEAVCYHHHSSTSRNFPPETIRLLQVRNPLLACFKNYDTENLRGVLPAALILTLRRTLSLANLDDAPFRIEGKEARRLSPLQRLVRRFRKRIPEKIDFGRVAAADLIGINDLMGNWALWRGRRDAIQGARRRSDAEIFRLFLRPVWCVEEDPAYRAIQDSVVELWGLDEMFANLTVPGEDPRH